jgi:hypothetical protein
MSAVTVKAFFEALFSYEISTLSAEENRASAVPARPVTCLSDAKRGLIDRSPESPIAPPLSKRNRTMPSDPTPAPKPWLASEAEGQARKIAPAVQRNRDAIASVLNDVLPNRGLVLELASGSGEHAVHFATLFPQIDWQPSDTEPHALASIEAWRQHAGRANMLPALAVDAAAPSWPISAADAVLCINMIHISPWSSTEGLIAGAGRLLKSGQPLLLYGPFLQAGVETAPSNLAFDSSLRARNPQWGVRAVEDVIALAHQHGFMRERIITMPAHNLFVALYM